MISIFGSSIIWHLPSSSLLTRSVEAEHNIATDKNDNTDSWFMMLVDRLQCLSRQLNISSWTECNNSLVGWILYYFFVKVLLHAALPSFALNSNNSLDGLLNVFIPFGAHTWLFIRFGAHTWLFYPVWGPLGLRMWLWCVLKNHTCNFLSPLLTISVPCLQQPERKTSSCYNMMAHFYF